MVTPVGAKPLNTQLAMSSVPVVLIGTDMAHPAGAGMPMVNCTGRLPGPAALVAAIVAANTPGVVGVPVIAPVTVLITRPGGNPVAL